MGKKNIPEVMYRLGVFKETYINGILYKSWMEDPPPWKGEDVLDPELDKLNCLWLAKIVPRNQISSTINRINGSSKKNVEGLIDDVQVIVVDVHVQRGEYNKNIKDYKWDNYDRRAPRGDLRPSMR